MNEAEKKENNRMVVDWFKKEMAVKKIIMESLKDLKPGNIFLEAIHTYHPKLVDVSKIYMKPKNNFEVLQNYKHLSNSFRELGWKRFQPEKYAKQQDKDCVTIANFIMKNLTENRKNRPETSKSQLFQSLIKNVNIPRPQTKQRQPSQIEELQLKKEKLLKKIINIEHIAMQATDIKSAVGLISKIIGSA